MRCCVGIEVHVQLAVSSKLFSAGRVINSNTLQPNSLVTEYEAALPGVLPRPPTRHTLERVVTLGSLLGSQINKRSSFDRKHYRYHDLPQAYQITQLREPICTGGSIAGVSVSHIQLEQDSGKSTYDQVNHYVDLNRVGTPLLEIVSQPEIDGSDMAVNYCNSLLQLLQYSGVSDADMSKGNMRMDINVSMTGADGRMGTRVEVKNLNSTVRVRDAIEYEVKRQSSILNSGGTVTQQTLGWDVQQGHTFPIRDKEQAVDYRYMSEGDLGYLNIPEDIIERCSQLEPPEQLLERYRGKYAGLSEEAYSRLVYELMFREYFLEAVENGGADPYQCFVWMEGELQRYCNEEGLTLDEARVSSSELADILRLVQTKRISGSMAKKLFKEMWDATESVPAEAIVKSKGWSLITDVKQLCRDIVAQHHEQRDQYGQADSNRQQRLFKFFMGQLMKETKGQVDPKVGRSAMLESLEELSKVEK